MRGQKRLHVLILMRICTHLGRLAGPIADRDPALTLLQVGYRENRSALRIRAATWARNHPVNGRERKISGASTHGHGAPLTWSGGLAVPRQTPSP